MRRTTRSQSRQTSNPPPTSTAPSTPQGPILAKNATRAPDISWTLPSTFTPKLTGLSRSSTTFLNNKRTKLHASITRPRRNLKPHLRDSINTTLVFAQEEAGTAVCISPSGLLLTCSHCVSDDEESAPDPTAAHWLIFANGQVVQAVCIAWDGRRDLALLQITHAEPPAGGPANSHTKSDDDASFPSFAHVTISPPGTILPLTTPLMCIGHPGSEDLEASTPGQATGYNVLHVSQGTYHGMAVGQDPQDNSEIGALMHDCWTYWGHSGAPILERETGTLVGLHSSWDEETGMRRGVGGEAIVAFLDRWTTYGVRDGTVENPVVL